MHKIGNLQGGNSSPQDTVKRSISPRVKRKLNQLLNYECLKPSKDVKNHFYLRNPTSCKFQEAGENLG